jgi:hypothetical protein
MFNIKLLFPVLMGRICTSTKVKLKRKVIYSSNINMLKNSNGADFVLIGALIVSSKVLLVNFAICICIL